MAGMDLPLDTALLPPGSRVLVAVSGGPDSLALLHVLAGRRRELGIELAAAHVHHGMRGEAADADVRVLEAVCAEWGVPLHVEHADVPGLARDRGVSVEEAGRDARYAAFGRLAAGAGCDRVATAHTADDQAETILQRLLRGSGIDGLAGIPALRPLHRAPAAPLVVRPLLRAWRRDVEAYCAAHGLEPRLDATNLDRRYQRSRIRLELLPLLEQYSPAVREHLVRLAVQAEEESRLLRPVALALLEEARVREPRPAWGCAVPHWEPPLILDAARLAAAEPALQRRAWKLLLEAHGDAEVDSALLQRLVALGQESGPASWDVPGAPLRARRSGRKLMLECRAARPAPPPVEIPVPGLTGAAGFGLRVTARVGPVPESLFLPPPRAALAPTVLHSPLLLRSARPGERFTPLGGPGSRLLSDLLSERRVPRELRRAWPVIADAEGALWVVGLAVAERARVMPAHQECLLLEVGPE